MTVTNYSEGYQVVAEAYIKVIKSESLGGPFVHPPSSSTDDRPLPLCLTFSSLTF